MILFSDSPGFIGTVELETPLDYGMSSSLRSSTNIAQHSYDGPPSEQPICLDWQQHIEHFESLMGQQDDLADCMPSPTAAASSGHPHSAGRHTALAAAQRDLRGTLPTVDEVSRIENNPQELSVLRDEFLEDERFKGDRIICLSIANNGTRPLMYLMWCTLTITSTQKKNTLLSAR